VAVKIVHTYSIPAASVVVPSTASGCSIIVMMLYYETENRTSGYPTLEPFAPTWDGTAIPEVANATRTGSFSMGGCITDRYGWTISAATHRLVNPAPGTHVLTGFTGFGDHIRILVIKDAGDTEIVETVETGSANEYTPVPPSQITKAGGLLLAHIRPYKSQNYVGFSLYYLVSPSNLDDGRHRKSTTASNYSYTASWMLGPANFLETAVWIDPASISKPLWAIGG
jgi:hypothetical protein